MPDERKTILQEESNISLTTNPSIIISPPGDEVSLYGLHQGQGVNLDQPALPGLEAGAVRVPLQRALEVVGLEELEGGSGGSDARRPRGEVVHLDGELLEVVLAGSSVTNVTVLPARGG